MITFTVNHTKAQRKGNDLTLPTQADACQKHFLLTNKLHHSTWVVRFLCYELSLDKPHYLCQEYEAEENRPTKYFDNTHENEAHELDDEQP